jgi:hypothetical protein
MPTAPAAAALLLSVGANAGQSYAYHHRRALGTKLDRAIAQLFRITMVLLMALAGPATAQTAATTAGVAGTNLTATPSTST